MGTVTASPFSISASNLGKRLITLTDSSSKAMCGALALTSMTNPWVFILK